MTNTHTHRHILAVSRRWAPARLFPVFMSQTLLLYYCFNTVLLAYRRFQNDGLRHGYCLLSLRFLLTLRVYIYIHNICHMQYEIWMFHPLYLYTIHIFILRSPLQTRVANCVGVQVKPESPICDKISVHTRQYPPQKKKFPKKGKGAFL